MAALPARPLNSTSAPGALPVVSCTVAAFIAVTTLLAAFASSSDAAQRASHDAATEGRPTASIADDAWARSYCFGA